MAFLSLAGAATSVIFVAANICDFIATKVLSRQNDIVGVSCHKYDFCRDKNDIVGVSCYKYDFCRDKNDIIGVSCTATSTIFVATKHVRGRREGGQ